MCSPISVSIDVPKWMVKFLNYQSENKSQPFIFPKRHEYNILLLKLVSNRSDIVEEIEKKSFERVKIKLPFSEGKDVYFYNKLNYIAKNAFRNHIREDFYFEFNVFVKHQLLAGMKRKDAINQFFSFYDITDEELNIDSFYRKYTRYIKKKEHNLLNTTIYRVKVIN